LSQDSQRSMRWALNRGVLAAAMADSLLLVGLYTILVPSSDLRARIPFLLSVGGVSVWFGLYGIFWISGLLILAIARPFNRWAVGGVTIGALIGLLILGTGSVAVMLPAGPETRSHYWPFLTAAVLSAGVLWWDGRGRSNGIGGRAT
jgi:hypothetical protein